MIKAVGIGPWGQLDLTERAKIAIETADFIFGSERQLALAAYGPSRVPEKAVAYETLKDLVLQLEDHSGRNFVVLASGDPSFYGIAKYLREAFGKDEVEVIPGISSVQYLFAKAHWDMNDVYMTSAHGRGMNMDLVLKMPKIAILTDALTDPYIIAQTLLQHKEDPILIIGEALGSDQEQITIAKASEVPKKHYEMNVVLIDRRDCLKEKVDPRER